MTMTQFAAYVTNVYAGAATLEAQAKIPTGEGKELARITIAALLAREAIDVPKV